MREEESDKSRLFQKSRKYVQKRDGINFLYAFSVHLTYINKKPSNWPTCMTTKESFIGHYLKSNFHEVVG